MSMPGPQSGFGIRNGETGPGASCDIVASKSARWDVAPSGLAMRISDGFQSRRLSRSRARKATASETWRYGIALRPLPPSMWRFHAEDSHVSKNM